MKPSPCGHSTCSECFARISDPSEVIATGENADGRGDFHCPSCRTKITTSRVIDSKTFKQVYMPNADENELLKDFADSQADVETTDESDSDEDSEDDVNEKGDLKDFIVDDDDDDDDDQKTDTRDQKVQTNAGRGTALGKTERQKSQAI